MTSSDGTSLDGVVIECVNCGSRAFSKPQPTIDKRWAFGLCLTCGNNIGRVAKPGE